VALLASFFAIPGNVRVGPPFRATSWPNASYSAQQEERGKDKDRVEGAATNIKGKIKEGVGKLTGDSKTEADGSRPGKGQGSECPGRCQGQSARSAKRRLAALKSPRESGGFLVAYRSRLSIILTCCAAAG
jgi:uncharacterized protein YjbJ (UPF0337 family)